MPKGIGYFSKAAGRVAKKTLKKRSRKLGTREEEIAWTRKEIGKVNKELRALRALRKMTPTQRRKLQSLMAKKVRFGKRGRPVPRRRRSMPVPRAERRKVVDTESARF